MTPDAWSLILAPDRRPVRRPPPRKRRLRPGEVRRRAETRRAAIILVAAVLAIVAVGVALYLSRTPQLDAATGCPVGQRVPPEHTVVLIDQTDPLTARQIDYAKSVILAEYDRLKPEGKLTIGSIRADLGQDDHDFSRCRVRRGADVSPITSNPDMIEAQFRHTVGDALNDYLNSLRHAPTAPKSPIVETVDAALDAPDFGPTVKARRLAIISDMAQNSSEISEYKGTGSGLDPSPAVRDELSRDMHGVAVRIHYVRRPALAAIQTPTQRAFWTDWFKRQGADVKLGWGLQLVDGRKAGEE
jgi:hypothetical protein